MTRALTLTVRSGILAAFAGLAPVGLACTFGEVADYESEAAARIAFIASRFPADRGTGRVALRFGDGGTDGFDTFNTGNAIVLSGANWIEIEKIEITTGTATASRTPLESALNGAGRWLDDFLPRLVPVSPLMAHGESSGGQDSGGETVSFGENQFLQPLEGGSTGNGIDSLARPYYEAAVPEVGFGSGTLSTLTLHIKRFQFSGTVDGTSFAVLHDATGDVSVALSCNTTINRGATTTIPIYINIAVLFRFLPSADATGVASAFASNVTSSDLIQEHECF